MSSSQKIAANKASASMSSAPRSLDGKAASRRNGVLNSVVIADDEDPEMFANLVAELTDEFQPVGPTETLLVEKVALSMWRNRRLALAERAKIDVPDLAGPRRTRE